MKRTITLSTLLIGVLFFASCKREESINIDQDRIYSNYAYTYDANSNQTKITATFRLDNNGGKKLKLSYPAKVDFNGENLSWSGALGGYTLSRSGSQLGGTFKYTDLNENVYTNAVDQVYPIEIPFGVNVISRGGNFFLPWEGDAIRSGETVRVTIRGVGGSKSWTETSVGASHIILDSNRLQQLEAGNATIQIERERSESLTQANYSGGRISTVYESRKINIQIN